MKDQMCASAHARKTLWIATAALLAGPPIWASTVVTIPAQYETIESKDNNAIPWGWPACPKGQPGLRYQQILRGSAVGQGLITELRFRQDAYSEVVGYKEPKATTTNYKSLTVRLSSTSQPVLGTTFAANLGPDAMVVYSGDLTFHNAASSSVPRPFDFTIRLQTPFPFNGSDKVHLLLDITLPSCSHWAAGALDFVDHAIDDTLYRAISYDGGATTATVLSKGGNVTQVVLEAASAPSLDVDGPQTGVTFELMEFSASATGCSPSSGGWQWRVVPDGSILVPSGGPLQTAFWLFPGVKTVEVTNSACGSAKGTRVVNVANASAEYLLVSADGKIDRKRPTIVFTHGLQESDFKSSELWSCIKPSKGCSELALDWWAGKLLANSKGLNRLQFVWRNAGQVQVAPTRLSYANARQWAPAAGEALADLLISNLGSNYSGTVHFVGHSLGTVVNARAAARMLARAPKVGTAQITVLDRPDHVNVLTPPLWCSTSWDPTWCGSGFEAVYGYSRTFLPAELAAVGRRKAGLRLDNYYAEPESPASAGVGDETAGIPGAKVYNHRRPQPGDAASCPGCSANWRAGLKEPNDVGGSYFEDEQTAAGLDNDHTGVHQWYRLTMDPNRVAPGICNDRVFNKPLFWDGSLNPCRQGWYWSLNGPDAGSFPTTKQGVFNATSYETEATTAESIPCRAESGLTCAAAWVVSPPILVDLPPAVRYLAVTVVVRDGQEGDWVALLVDNVVYEIRPVRGDRLAETLILGPVPISSDVSVAQIRILVTGPSRRTTTHASVSRVDAIADASSGAE